MNGVHRLEHSTAVINSRAFADKWRAHLRQSQLPASCAGSQGAFIPRIEGYACCNISCINREAMQRTQTSLLKGWCKYTDTPIRESQAKLCASSKPRGPLHVKYACTNHSVKETDTADPDWRSRALPGKLVLHTSATLRPSSLLPATTKMWRPPCLAVRHSES